jgi:hypothetical protein
MGWGCWLSQDWNDRVAALWDARASVFAFDRLESARITCTSEIDGIVRQEMDVSDSDILKAIEKNGVAHSVYWCHWPKMRLVGHPHAVVTESELPCPFFNNVFSANVPESNAEAIVDDLIRRFLSRSVSCFWWSGPVNHDERVTDILEARGFVNHPCIHSLISAELTRCV